MKPLLNQPLYRHSYLYDEEDNVDYEAPSDDDTFHVANTHKQGMTDRSVNKQLSLTGDKCCDGAKNDRKIAHVGAMNLCSVNKEVVVNKLIALDFGEISLMLSESTNQGVSEYDKTTSSFTEICNRVDV